MRGIAILFCGLKLMAQQDVAINGTVVETATSPVPIDTDVTAAAGTFHISAKEPGKYAVEASAPGYQDSIYGDGAAGIVIDGTALQAVRSTQRIRSHSS